MSALEVRLNGEVVAILRDTEPAAVDLPRERADEVDTRRGASGVPNYDDRVERLAQTAAELFTGIGLAVSSEGDWSLIDRTFPRNVHRLHDSDVISILVVG